MPTETLDSVLTAEQEAEMRHLRTHFPYRIVWGEIVPVTGVFSAYASPNRRALNKSLRAGNIISIFA